MSQFILQSNEYAMYLEWTNRISHQDSSFNLNDLSEQDCLNLFRFEKKYIVRIITAVAWPIIKTHTNRNRYKTNKILSTCVLIHQIYTPGSWS